MTTHVPGLRHENYDIMHAMKIVSVFFAALLAAAAGAADAPRVFTCAELADIAAGEKTDAASFETTARIILINAPSSDGFYADDATGAAHFGDKRPFGAEPLRLGATYRLRGTIWNKTQFYCESCELVATGDAPAIAETTAERFLSGAEDNRPVMLRGTVRDIFRDENDPRFLYMPLISGGEIVYCAFQSPHGDERKDLVGAEIMVTGVCSPVVYNNRRQIGRTLHIRGIEDVKVLKTADADPFNVPELGNLRRESPSRIPLLGRRRLSGRVIAVWGKTHLILQRPDGEMSNIELSGANAPQWGDLIEVAGFPETDLYRVNLVRAVWRLFDKRRDAASPSQHDHSQYAASQRDASRNAAIVSPRKILTDSEGRASIDPLFHGRTIKIKGRVATLPGGDSERLNIEADNCIVPVELDPRAEESPGLVPDAIVEATGVCVMETENWRQNSIFPRMKGFFLVVRSPSDMRVLSRPSWWTPHRLLALVCLLVFIVIAVLIWNRTLSRLSEERGRKLAEERMESVRSELKYLERTSLATELHDAISQNLTGISMELRAMDALRESMPEDARIHLDMASRTVSSCRNELRNVLHDLRNNALESATMDEALRIALAPHVGDAELSVRFSAPRSAFTEKSAHAIIHIVRELVTNAVRHGGAKHIRVAGAFEADALKFSVTDDGCGFDPAASPGADEGHFGLQGVRERVDGFGGEIAIESAPGKGTRVTVEIKRHRT